MATNPQQELAELLDRLDHQQAVTFVKAFMAVYDEGYSAGKAEGLMSGVRKVTEAINSLQMQEPSANPSLPLDASIEEFDLKVKTRLSLLRAGVRTIDDLIKSSPSDLLDINNFGKKSLEEVTTVLATAGYKLRDDK